MLEVCSCFQHHNAQLEAALDLLGICREAGFAWDLFGSDLKPSEPDGAAVLTNYE